MSMTLFSAFSSFSLFCRNFECADPYLYHEKPKLWNNCGRSRSYSIRRAQWGGSSNWGEKWAEHLDNFAIFCESSFPWQAFFTFFFSPDNVVITINGMVFETPAGISGAAKSFHYVSFAAPSYDVQEFIYDCDEHKEHPEKSATPATPAGPVDSTDPANRTAEQQKDQDSAANPSEAEKAMTPDGADNSHAGDAQHKEADKTADNGSVESDEEENDLYRYLNVKPEEKKSLDDEMWVLKKKYPVSQISTMSLCIFHGNFLCWHQYARRLCMCPNPVPFLPDSDRTYGNKTSANWSEPAVIRETSEKVAANIQTHMFFCRLFTKSDKKSIKLPGTKKFQKKADRNWKTFFFLLLVVRRV